MGLLYPDFAIVLASCTPVGAMYIRPDVPMTSPEADLCEAVSKTETRFSM